MLYNEFMPFTEMDFTQFITALSFAAEKHRDQRRKDNHASPYINHPIQVAETIWRIGGIRDLSVLTAAILHDTIEDTHTSAEEIESIFGADICQLVLEVTDDKSLPKAERKQLQVLHAGQISARARLIKLGDKICNVHDLIQTPPPDWTLERKREYLQWACRVVDGMRGANPPLEAEFDRVYSEGMAILDEF